MKNNSPQKIQNLEPMLEDEFSDCGHTKIQRISLKTLSVPTIQRITKIAIYGLSGDPPTGTIGHRGVASYIASLGEFSELLILPVYQHPFRFTSKKRKLSLYEDRVRMCELNFCPLSTDNTLVKVSLLEKILFDNQESLSRQTNYSSPLSKPSRATQDVNIANEPSQSTPTVIGTIDVVKEILSNCAHPDLRIHLVLGSDTYNDLTSGKWKSGDSLLELVDIEVILRPGVELNAAHAETVTGSPSNSSDSRLCVYAPFGRRHRIHRLACLGEVSSTQVRSDLRTVSLVSSGRDNETHSESDKLKLISDCEARLEVALDTEVLKFVRTKEIYSESL